MQHTANMQQSSFHGFRGMQIHAVPESERAIDPASGRKLPWAYEGGTSLENREPVEKGAFGRSQRRSRSGLSRSRSKTAEPRREEDRIKAEQMAGEDAVFGSLRKTNKDAGGREALGEVDANAVAQPATRDREQEATEVLLYGFGEELQWAALDHYERISGGSILEDYDRQPLGQRYDVSRSLGRAASQKSLSRAALRKKNRYAGGLHWIKITFDSRGAADLALARSPQLIKGHQVYAQEYQGAGPIKDEPIFASQAGVQITDDFLPTTFQTNTAGLEGSPNGSSTTATSATATGRQDSNAAHAAESPIPVLPRSPLFQQTSAAPVPAPAPQSSQPQLSLRRRGLIPGATVAAPLPASAAILPKQPKQSWSARLGTGEVIGSMVPKREDGSFDYEKASLYWRFFHWIDWLLGSDFCGMKAD